MDFQPVKKLKVADQVAASIRHAIVGGKFRSGDALPSERALASQFGVNRSSVREALLRLEAWGLVQIRQGGATRVQDVFLDAGINMLPYLLAPNGQLDFALLGDIFSIRVMFLGWTGQQAALNARPEDIGRLRDLLREIEASQDPEEVQRLDFEFFEVLVKMTGNRVMSLFVNALREIYRQNAKYLLLLYRRLPFDTQHHRAALAAIVDGDAEAAGDAMRAYGESALRGVA
jgi:DNA-binding FadR family transcriptional regulator